MSKKDTIVFKGKVKAKIRIEKEPTETGEHLTLRAKIRAKLTKKHPKQTEFEP